MDRIVVKDKASGKTLIEIDGEKTTITENLIEKRKKLLEDSLIETLELKKEENINE